ncbi:TetR/AcrR family transcriptional regulator [Phenylobacterium sp.]|uniref:TetR/AcrR family transcriptional regulator n=1 Tax=Phenylobacterium sp. TaxID=1871053 RepID=UPI0028117E67|nr:TetR/AcrR family transcriptional regulator [Phenylobacterium sp.]
MIQPSKVGRPNQKQRTRKDLLDAAARLVREGRRPSLEEVAEAALVSRATAYRYFPSVEALLLEASVHVAAPDASILDDAPPADALARVRKVDAAFDAMILANEAPLRLMLARILETSVRAGAQDLPARQNRRAPLIEAALAPARDAFDPEALDKLTAALAIVIGTESFVVTRDVLRLSDDEAREVRDWAIAALIGAARRR